MKNQEEKTFAKLFIDNQHYSSSEQCSLSSTTFKLLHSNYCIHCGSKALLIQSGLSDWNHHKHYETTGYRCDCNGAFEEMIECLALSLFHSITNKRRDTISFPTFAVKKEIYLSLLSKLKEEDLPLDGKNGHFTIIPVINKPDYQDFKHFKHDNKHEINWHLKDKYHATDEIVVFIKRVYARIEELAQARIEEAKKMQEESLKIIDEHRAATEQRQQD